jgi:acyl transferase domain-containing protein
MIGLEVAVIGMSCRFPGARDTDEFWENLKNGVESTAFFPLEELSAANLPEGWKDDPGLVGARGIVEEAEFFDPYFFGHKPWEAEIMDPQIRLFYEICWEALEVAGYVPDNCDEAIGLYAGATNNRNWEMRAFFSGKAETLGVFTLDHLVDRDFLSTRIAYKLNLKGPAVTLKTACSTSLVAVDAACRGLLTGLCDIALAGGVSLQSNSAPAYLYRDGMIKSPDGHCRAFDAKAQGVVFSDGAGVVVLRRLQEAVNHGDTIYAIIKASAVNNDGSGKGTYESPCIEGQADVIETAIHMADVDPETITYVETHGTGTIIGDPIEIEGLRRAFNSGKKRFCAVGSVKTNFGHLDTAAGIAGFIKAVLALKHRLIPPSLHFENPNPKIDFENSPFYVNTKLAPWENPGSDSPLRAGVSSFGVGGTNAHVVLEEAPAPHSTSAGRRWQLIPVSAFTPSALEKVAESMTNYLAKNPADIADAAYTLAVGRKAFKYRTTWVIDPVSPNFEKAHTAAVREKNPPVFMFSGQGAQYVDMGRDIYHGEPLFRREMDRCFKILEPLMTDDPKKILYPAAGDNESDKSDSFDTIKINRTEIAQPMIFALEYALARLLMAWGITPYAMIGHSIGEYVAACLSGVFSLEDGLKLVTLRGELMQQMPTGSMLSVTLPEDELKPLLRPYGELSLAAVNAPSLCTVSGPHAAVDAFEEQLKTMGCECRRLHTSHAFHSAMMEPVLLPFEEAVKRIPLNKPQLPYISNVTGSWITVEDAVSPRYWADHLRSTVRFDDGAAELLKEPGALFIEIGPGRSLTTFVNKHDRKESEHLAVNLVRHPGEVSPDDYFLLNKIGRLWLYGVDIDWAAFYAAEKRNRIPLPTYPFERRLYRIQSGPPGFDMRGAAAGAEPGKKADISRWLYVPSWKRSGTPRFNSSDTPGPLNWLFFIDNEETGGRIGSELIKQLDTARGSGAGTVTVVRPGVEFALDRDGAHALDLRRPDHYNLLIARLKEQGRPPHRIVHCLLIGPEDKGTGDPKGEWDETLEYKGFYSLIYLAQALGKEEITGDIRLTVITANMQAVTGDEDLCPRKAAVLGPAAIIPLEYSNIRCRSIDIDTPLPGGKKEGTLIRSLAAELIVEIPVEDSVAAYRSGFRLTQTYEPLPMEASPTDVEIPCLKKNGVYLVTGGTGGIGLEIARYLSRTVGARLALTGLSPLPPGEEWRRWLDTHGSTGRQGKKIRKLLELEEMGTEFLTFTADVSDYEQMQRVFSAVEEQWGTVNGVIHAAGVPGGGMIQLKTPEVARRVMAPKIKGTLVLDALLEHRQPDFFILCSSVNSVLPRLGQVDYYAANAFLDAFAYRKHSRSDTFTVSINWDTWQEVGMAVDAASQYIKEYDVDHPLFDRWFREDANREIYITHFELNKHWPLNEHKIAESGKGLLPGVTYLEMAREAFERHMATEGGSIDRSNAAVEISDVFFLNPLVVGDGELRETRLVLEKQPQTGGYEFRVRGRSGTDGEHWQKHATGKIRNVEPGDRDSEITHNIEEISAACGKEELRTSDDKGHGEGGLLLFGPRWKSRKWIRLGEDRGLGFFKLDDAFSNEPGVFKLHPALLDSAAGFLFGQLEKGSAYIPFSYKRLTMRKPLTPAVFSYARMTAGNGGGQSDSLKFDITITDERGVELVDIKEFTMLKVSEERKEKIKEKETAGAVDGGLERRSILKNGILPSEGIDVFRRVLGGTLPQVVVSTTDLAARIRESTISPLSIPDGEAAAGPSSGPSLPRPEISAVYAAPKTDLERKIAAAWQELLGIEKIGIHDDFFELGGDSLNIVQLNDKLKKIVNRDVPVAVLFQHQTIHGIIRYLGLGEETGSASVEAIDDTEEIQKGRSRLKARMSMR